METIRNTLGKSKKLIKSRPTRTKAGLGGGEKSAVFNQIENSREDHLFEDFGERGDEGDWAIRSRRRSRFLRLKNRDDLGNLPLTGKETRRPRRVKNVKKKRTTRRREVRDERVADARRIKRS